MKQKRGISETISIILFVLLAIVSVSVAAVVIKKVVSEKGGEVNTIGVVSDVRIEKAELSPGEIKVKIRNVIGKNIEKVKIIVVGNSGFENHISPEGLLISENKIFSFSTNMSQINKIDIYPVYSINGKEIVGNIADSETTIEVNASVLNTGLKAYYKFDGNANDELGINNGVLNGGMSCTSTGKVGQACSFDGVNDYVDTNTLILNDGAGAISLWFNDKEGNIATDHVLIGSTNSAASRRTYLAIRNGKLAGSFGTQTWTTIFGTKSLSNNAWNHGVIVWDAATIELYLNGSLEYSGARNGLASDLKLFFGANDFNLAPNNFFNGLIDETRVYNRALSQAEIKWLYNNP